MVGVRAVRSSSRRAPRDCSALSATFPCVTLSPSGAQAGAMPGDGELVRAATNGKLEEVRRLIKDRANIEERDKVSGGAGRRGGSSVAKGILVWCAVLNMVQGCCERFLCGRAEPGVGYLSCIYVHGHLKSISSRYLSKSNDPGTNDKDTFDRLETNRLPL